MKDFLNKCCRINKIKPKNKDELFKQLKNNCYKSIYKNFFNE
jgi:hypothetical protein